LGISIFLGRDVEQGRFAIRPALYTGVRDRAAYAIWKDSSGSRRRCFSSAELCERQERGWSFLVRRDGYLVCTFGTANPGQRALPGRSPSGPGSSSSFEGRAEVDSGHQLVIRLELEPPGGGPGDHQSNHAVDFNRRISLMTPRSWRSRRTPLSERRDFIVRPLPPQHPQLGSLMHERNRKVGKPHWAWPNGDP